MPDQDPRLLYWQHLAEGMRDQSRTFDRGILGLASGGLALTLVFMDKVAPEPLCWSFPFLVATWVCLVLSISSTLASLLTGMASHKKRLDEHFPGVETESNAAHSRNRPERFTLTTVLNIASMVFFILGVILFMVFAGANVHVSHTQGGFHMPDKAHRLLTTSSEHSVEAGWDAPPSPFQSKPSEAAVQAPAAEKRGYDPAPAGSPSPNASTGTAKPLTEGTEVQRAPAGSSLDQKKG